MHNKSKSVRSGPIKNKMRNPNLFPKSFCKIRSIGKLG